MSISIIILTFNEEKHIERCVKSILPVSNNIFVVDSYSTDKTVEIAKFYGAKVFQNPFINQAIQFQWGVDECNIQTEWILRIDADETIDQELVSSIQKFINTNSPEYNGAIFNRKHIFLGKWIRFGGRYPLPMLRLFRKGTAHIEQRWMDEHIVLDSGTATTLSGGFSDININSVSWFIDKHNKYATREMIDIMLKKLQLTKDSGITLQTGFKIRLKRYIKENVYGKLPYFIRPFLYFIFRYFIQLGFLDGARGFAYHFMQGFWYRTLVDLKCIEVDMAWSSCANNQEKIKVLERISEYSLKDHNN